MFHRFTLAIVFTTLCACQAGSIQPALAPYDGPIDSSAIVQGEVADCFLISVLQQLADKDAHYIRSAIYKRGDGVWRVRLFVDDEPKYFDVDQNDLERTYALTTDGSIWPNLIEAAILQSGVSLNYGNSALAMSMVTGKHTQAQPVDVQTVAQAVLYAEEGLPSVVCSTKHTSDFSRYHCYGLHMHPNKTLYLEDPLVQYESPHRFITPDDLHKHFAYVIHLGH